MSAALEVQGITKVFGKLTAVDDATFSLERGEICGFIGPNGAGKTTTMRIISTLDLPDAGDVRVDGRSVLEEPRDVRGRLGFMPDSYGAYTNTTVLDYLDFFARAYGLRGKERARTIRQVVDFTGLEPLLWKEITALSKGMRQRLCLAKTLLHDPALLVLDEPASGLDPRARVELRELVVALSDLDKAVLISSHILTELAEMCTNVVVIEQGRIRATGSVDSITRGLQPEARVFLRTLSPRDEARRVLLEEPHVEAVRVDRDGLSFTFRGTPDDLSALVTSLVNKGLRPIQFAPDETSLEDLFLSLTEGKVQ